MIDVANKRVTVMGLGLSGGGVGVAQWLLKHGAIVTVTDLKPEEQLRDSIAAVKSVGMPVEFALGKHREQDFTDTDLVIKNPGVPDGSPYLQAARKAKVLIDTDIGIFVQNFPGTIAGVTGTKGKTTTTTLLHKLCQATGRNVLLGGNLRKSPLDDLDNATSDTLAVLELSSFQLEIFKQHKFSPHIAVWTNLYPDHLDRYKTMREYAAAKSHIMVYQKKDDVFITSADQAELVKLSKKAKGQVVLCSAKKRITGGLYLAAGKYISELSGQPEVLAELSKVKLRGQHNVLNILQAMAAAQALQVPAQTIREVTEGFTGVANRLQSVRTVKGVEYVNDTASTIPSSVIAALNAFDQPIVLIAGGSEKNLPLEEMAAAVLTKVKKVVLLETPVGLAVAELMAQQDPTNAKGLIDKPFARSMRDAVQQASVLAQKGDVVLLSPGAASFGMFRNEFDRGDQFVAAVKAL
ncbi:MAG: UDP-N-acetylmuramoyl-L-alanine--D-glutamate ligase [Candidatus Andersenbacteria bacterium]